MLRQCLIKQREPSVLSLPFTSLLLSTSRQHRARALAPKSSKLSLIEHGPYMGGWPLHATLCAHTTIDHSTTQHKLRPFWGVWQATRKDDAAECKSTLDLLPEDLSLSCFGEGKLTQMSKRQGYQFFFCAMPFSWFLFCHVEHHHLTTCTKACQTISGLVRKTRGRLIIPRHAIGWNLRVCLLWLTGVESSIL